MIEEIGKKFKIARKTLGLTQDEVCKKVGISRVYYSNIERGTQVPKLETVIQIADTLKLPDIFDEYLENQSNNRLDYNLLNDLESLEQEQMEKIRDTIVLVARNLKDTRTK